MSETTRARQAAAPEARKRHESIPGSPAGLARVLAVALIAALTLASSVTAQEEPTEEDGGRTWAEVREAYEKAKRKAKAMGESVPERVPDWVIEDLKNVGDWEYRVVEASSDELEVTLNELGAERWECFSVEPAGRKGQLTQLVFKRRKRSRLRELQDLSPDDLLTVIKLIRDHRLDKE